MDVIHCQQSRWVYVYRLNHHDLKNRHLISAEFFIWKYIYYLLALYVANLDTVALKTKSYRSFTEIGFEVIFGFLALKELAVLRSSFGPSLKELAAQRFWLLQHFPLITVLLQTIYPVYRKA